MHLLLPPSPAQATNSTNPKPNKAGSLGDHPPGIPSLHNRRVRYRAPNPLRPDEVAQSLHENARRRLIEAQPLHESGELLPQPQRTRPSLHTSSRHLPPLPAYAAGLPNPPTSNTAPFAPMPNLPLMDLGDGLHLPEDARARLRLLKQYISLAEEQLNCGIVPTIEHIIQLRTHLFVLLDEQTKRPKSERGEFIEPLITRVFDISTRADVLRQPPLLPTEPRPRHEESSHGPTAPMYFVSSPNGYQAVLATSVASDAVRTLGASQIPAPTLAPEGRQADVQPNMQPNADAAVMENVVRQAVLNQRPVADGHFAWGRNLRRLWLFVRLYFFCHMFSAPGTQTRVLYVTLALIVSVLSETDVPRRVYEMVLAPVQRHLEGLVHFTPDEQVQQRPHGAETVGNEPAADQEARVQLPHEVNWATGICHTLRRMERSAALFLASLVPGVGERHIEVRNAVEAARNAELARQEDEQRQQQEEAASAQENSAGVNEDNAPADTGTEALDQPQRAIPQEAH